MGSTRSLCLPVPESRTEGMSRRGGEALGFCTQHPGRAEVGCLSPGLWQGPRSRVLVLRELIHLLDIFSATRTAHSTPLCTESSPTPTKPIFMWDGRSDCSFSLKLSECMPAILALKGCQQHSLLRVDVSIILHKPGIQETPSLALLFSSNGRPSFKPHRLSTQLASWG